MGHMLLFDSVCCFVFWILFLFFLNKLEESYKVNSDLFILNSFTPHALSDMFFNEWEVAETGIYMYLYEMSWN